MKIALIHYRLLLKGGLETRLFNYINYLQNNGHEVYLIVSKIDKTIPVPKDLKIIHIDLSAIPKPVRMYFFNKALKKRMKQFSFNFSLSLGRTAWQEAVLCPGNHLGYLKAMKINIPSPIDLMNVYLDKKAFRQSKIIFAASGMIKNELIDLYKIDAQKIEVAYPPVNTGKFNRKLKLKKDQIREKYHIKKGKKIFLFVSSSHRIKNFDLLRKVFTSLNEDVELIVAGSPIPEGLKNIRGLGFIKDIHELHAAADFLIHPSKYEPYGQVVAEALACGTPVIISKMVGAKELVSSKEGIIVEDFDPENWRKAIYDALQTFFDIPEDFAEKNKLTLKDHMQQILPK